MGKSATGRSKPNILRVRISEELDQRILDLMVAFKWTGTKDQFTAYLVERGLDLVWFEQQEKKGSIERFSKAIQDSPEGRVPGDGKPKRDYQLPSSGEEEKRKES